MLKLRKAEAIFSIFVQLVALSLRIYHGQFDAASKLLFLHL